MRKVDLVVFDMVGTTIEDRGEVITAFLVALHESGVPATEQELQVWRGASKREVLRAFVAQQFGPEDRANAARVERAYGAFRTQLEGRYLDDGAQPIAGVEATFGWLREQGTRIALTTGFYRAVTDIILQALGWNEGQIDASVCSDEVVQGRPAPYMIFRAMEATAVQDVHRVIKVGDTALDLQAGTNAGVRGVVGVLSGSQGIAQLGSAAHTYILPSVAELPDLIQGW
jgi:phosphonatase-like hydrolase